MDWVRPRQRHGYQKLVEKSVCVTKLGSGTSLLVKRSEIIRSSLKILVKIIFRRCRRDDRWRRRLLVDLKSQNTEHSSCVSLRSCVAQERKSRTSILRFLTPFLIRLLCRTAVCFPSSCWAVISFAFCAVVVLSSVEPGVTVAWRFDPSIKDSRL